MMPANLQPTNDKQCHLSESEWQGFRALSLDNGLLRAVVLPDLGGKIVSLWQHRTQREWLWHNPDLSLAAGHYDGDYVRCFDTGGMDECFPSVASCHYPHWPWAGTRIPDHGELWALPWHVQVFEDASVIELRMRVHGVRFPYRFERVIWLEAGHAALRFSYRVENLSPFPFSFLWSSHPVLALEPGMRVLLQPQPMRVYGSPGERLGRFGDVLTWPTIKDDHGREWHLDVAPPQNSALAVKLWGRAPVYGVVGLRHEASDSELQFHVDPTEITHLGLWLNYGGWSGVDAARPYYNLAIEPCLGAQDSLAIASDNLADCAVVGGFEHRGWQMELKLI